MIGNLLSPTRRAGALRRAIVLTVVAACGGSDSGIGVSSTCTVSSVNVTPPTSDIAAGASTTLTASVAQAGCDPSPQVGWQSSATSVATVANGVVTGVSAGTATITASAGGKSGTATVAVHVGVATVTLSAPATTVSIAATLQATAQAKDAAGNTLNGPAFTWNTSNSAVATVSQSGQITGVTAGTANITATADGKTGTLAITVIGVPSLSITSRSPLASATSVGIESTIQIQFSAALNAASVSATTVKVTAGATTVTGTLAVNGNTVTFTPVPFLAEFNTTYTVTVTTGVLSSVGNFLPAQNVATFTTVFADPAYYYRITNEFQGPTKSLDTFAGSFGCFMGATSTASGQAWYLSAVAGQDGYFVLKNQFQGEAQALEGGDGTARCLLTPPASPGAFFTGQAWKPVPFGGSFPTGYRLQNLNLGAAKSLDVMVIANEPVPIMQTTGNVSGQIWYFTRLTHR